MLAVLFQSIMKKIEEQNEQITKRIEILEQLQRSAEEQINTIIESKNVVVDYSDRILKLALEIKRIDDKIFELSEVLK